SVFTRTVDAWIGAWNSTFTNNNAKTDSQTRTNRLLAFDRGAPHEQASKKTSAVAESVTPEGIMNMYIGRLQPTDWFWFRYFTFEYLAAAEQDFSGKSEARQAAEFGRWLYLDDLTEHFRHEQIRMGSKAEDPRELARRAWRKALSNSVGLTH